MTDAGQTTPVLHAGATLDDASAVVILVHGRGATAESIMGLAGMVSEGDESTVAWLAPQALNNTWYPLPFTEELEANEPHRSNALALLDSLFEQVIEAGVAPNRIGLIGFSQGACLSLEYAAVGKYMPAFVGALSGGVMGPLGEPRVIEGSRAGMSVFVGCGDQDGHIPIERAEESAKFFEDADATVDFRRYNGMDHTINDDEVNALRQAVSNLATR